MIYLRVFFSSAVILFYGICCAQEIKSWSVNSLKDLDLKPLIDHLNKKLIYPEDAKTQKIQGSVFIAFQTDDAGKIVPSSVHAINSLSKSLDKEAKRVVTGFTLPLLTLNVKTPAKHGVFIVPVNFRLTDPKWTLEFPRNQLFRPLQTIVIEKTTKTKSSEWSIYARKGMNQQIAKISPGDSVTVTGWSAWSYFIQSKKGTGYVSHKSLLVTEELDSLARIIAERSVEEERSETQPEKIVVGGTLEMNMETAYFSVTTNRKSILAGECVTVTAAFNVYEKNQVPIYFSELASQLAVIEANELNAAKYFIVNSRIENIEGVEVKKDGDKVLSYTIYKAAYCPTKPMTINIPSIKLRMLVYNNSETSKIPNVGVFKSSPVAIAVKSSPAQGHVITGDFSSREEISKKEILAGESFQYKFTIHGKGLAFTLPPPQFNYTGLQSQLVDIVDSDTIIGQELHTAKSFVYEMILEKEGTFDFGPLFSIPIFNSELMREQVIKPNLKVVVNKGVDNKKLSHKKIPSHNFFVAFDISRSMELEDYVPNRLNVVKKGVKNFLQSRGACDVGVIYFGGNAKVLMRGESECFATESLDTLSFYHVKPGSAMGKAVWLAANSIKKNNSPNKIVIISDGDNTFGVFTPSLIVALARQHNMKIYTIGIGSIGLVPFGKDDTAQPRLYDNTFSDVYLKELSAETGGTYTFAKNAAEITTILANIFSK